MKRNQRYVITALLCAMSALAPAQETKPGATPSTHKSLSSPVRAQVEISALLNDFLSNVDDPATHERFWADDLIYTSAGGVVRTKAEILKNMRAGDTPGTRNRPAGESKAAFSAEDVQVRQFGDVAVLNFRLVQHDGDKTNYFRNSGTFVNRDGKWQAVSWQATREVPPAPEQPKPSGK
jgi:hypothetical protein